MRSLIVYGLFDPPTGELRYVGKSTYGIARCREHFNAGNLARQGKTRKTDWIKGLLAQGLVPEYGILEICETSQELAAAEMWNIAYFRSLGCCLTNVTKGGDGTLGYKHSDATKGRIAESNRTRVISPETRSRMSAAQLARPPCVIPTASKSRMIEASKNRVWSAASREKLAASLRGRTLSAATRAKLAEKASQRKLTSETKTKLSNIQKQRVKTRKRDGSGRLLPKPSQ